MVDKAVEAKQLEAYEDETAAVRDVVKLSQERSNAQFAGEKPPVAWTDKDSTKPAVSNDGPAV